MSFSEALASAMWVRRIGPTELARRAGVDRKTVYNYLNGRKEPRAEIIDKFAAALGCATLEDIEFEPPPSFQRLNDQRVNELQAAIAEFCRTCEPVDLICRDNQCPLRPVSPLKFIPLARRVA